MVLPCTTSTETGSGRGRILTGTSFTRFTNISAESIREGALNDSVPSLPYTYLHKSSIFGGIVSSNTSSKHLR